MISHHHECVFVHIPRNAGQSIEHVFLDLLGLTWETRAPLLLRPTTGPEPDVDTPVLAHLTAREYVTERYLPQALFDEYFSFAFVRNPWERVFSFYRYLGYQADCDFGTFATEILPGELWEDKAWFVRPQTEFVCDGDGRLLVDFVGRFERLQDDFDHVCRALDIGPRTLPHVNRSEPVSAPAGGLGGLVRSIFAEDDPEGSDPTASDPQWDDESRRTVAELYRSDIERFGYRFPDQG